MVRVSECLANILPQISPSGEALFFRSCYKYIFLKYICQTTRLELQPKIE